MSIYNQVSQPITVFHAFPALEKSVTLVWYAALIAVYKLSVPAPDYLCAIGLTHRRLENGRWRLFTSRHKPDDSLQGHLTFALKYEGVDLPVLKALFESIEAQQITDIMKSEPPGAYSRQVWFLYERLFDTQLDSKYSISYA